MFLKGKREKIILNGREVEVIKPSKDISYEEGVKRIDKLIEEIKRKAGIRD